MIAGLAYNGPMGSDEVAVSVVAAIIACALYARTAFLALRLHPMLVTPRLRAAVLAAAPVITGGLALLLNGLAASDVRGDPRYVFFFTALGAAWFQLIALFAFPLLGALPIREMLQRRSAPSVVLYVSALASLALCYAGANFGEGPGWGVVIASAIPATLGLLLIWTVIEIVSRASEAVAIERDLAAAIRLSGALLAASLIFGRAVAGSWQGAANLYADFAALGWPALAIATIEPALHRFLRATPEFPRPSPVFAGALPAIVYLAFAGWLVVRNGWWI
jgi:hypothetical protein